VIIEIMASVKGIIKTGVTKEVFRDVSTALKPDLTTGKCKVVTATIFN